MRVERTHLLLVEFSNLRSTVLADRAVYKNNQESVSASEASRATKVRLTLVVGLQRRLATQASDRSNRKLHQTSDGGRGDADRPRVLSGQQRVGLVAQDRLEDSHQRLRQLVLEVVLCVDRNVVLEDVDWVLRLFVRGGACGGERRGWRQVSMRYKGKNFRRGDAPLTPLMIT